MPLTLVDGTLGQRLDIESRNAWASNVRSTTMSANLPRMRLMRLAGTWRLDHDPTRHAPRDSDDDWLALVRAPEGLTAIRPAHERTPHGERWQAFYDRDAGHSLDAPGLLLAVIGPLAGASIPVFVCSTFHADLVLVPVAAVRDATVALSAAGHQVVGNETS